MIAGDVRDEPDRHVALFELGLEATRTELLRGELQRWQEAHIRLAELGCRAVGLRRARSWTPASWWPRSPA